MKARIIGVAVIVTAAVAIAVAAGGPERPCESASGYEQPQCQDNYREARDPRAF